MEEGEYFMPDPDKDDRKGRREDMGDAAAAFDPGAGMTAIPLPVAVAIGFILGVLVPLLWNLPGH